MSASHRTLNHQFLQEVSLFQWPKRQDIFSIYPFTSKISWVILHHSLLNLKYIINFCFFVNQILNLPIINSWIQTQSLEI